MAKKAKKEVKAKEKHFAATRQMLDSSSKTLVKEHQAFDEWLRNRKQPKANVSQSCKCCKIILIASAFIIIPISIYIYNTVTYVPPMPELDLNVWWGPNTTAAQDTSVRPFRILFTDAMLIQIARKFELYRGNVNRKKSMEETWAYGMNSEALARLFAHWQFKYSYRERVKYLNKFDHFKTNIQGLDMHFMHVKPKVDDNVKVVPLLLLHGWPGSIREFYEAIPLLTTARPGYDFVFEVIAPSLPGFIYSEGTNKPGLCAYQMAIILRNLMQRLGFKQYYIQGGDFGHTIASHLVTIFPKEVLGYHTNFPGNFAKLSYLTWIFGAICPSLAGGGIEDRRYPLKDKLEFYVEESGYMHLQGTKPDTIGIVLNDSPIGLAAYILDKFMIFTDPNNKLLEDGGISKYYTMTNLIDNVMLYWSTESITTSMRVYKETFKNSEMEQILSQIPSQVPTWALRLKYEIVHDPDFILRWKFPNLVGATNLDFGGHFAAFELPQEFSDDVFLAVKSFLKFQKQQ